MNFLRWWSVALMLLGATMALTLGVVCLMYQIYMDSSPELREQWPALVRSVGLFALLALIGAAAVVPLWRKNRWLWPTQALLLVGAVAIGMTFWKLMSS